MNTTIQINGKQSYRMALDDNHYNLLTWTGTRWQVDQYIGGTLDGTRSTSTSAVATPDLATFTGNYSFVNP